MEWLKGIAGKLIGGAIALAVIAAAVSWYQTDPETRHALVANTVRVLGWGGIVLAVPWAGFAVIGWVSRFERNSAGAALVSVLTLLEAVMLLWLFGWGVHGTLAWTFVLLGGLLAAVYNLLTCDWIAEKVS